MAATLSTMLPLGTTAPDFSLVDTVTDTERSLDDLRGRTATVIMFICNHCPYVKHVNDGLVELANDYSEKGVAFVAISSNDADGYPEDSPAKMKEYAERLHYPFPYLYDETQEVARAYQAACTPDFYVFDADKRLAYRGQLDDSRPSNGLPVTGRDIRSALDALVAGQPVDQEQRPSIGCNIKWRV
jgi:peroxiredoxin